LLRPQTALLSRCELVANFQNRYLKSGFVTVEFLLAAAFVKGFGKVASGPRKSHFALQRGHQNSFEAFDVV
jgi:hypothetical protein